MTNLINIWEVLTIIFLHWIADFIFQTDWQAKNKSKNNVALLDHTLTYSAALYIPFLVLLMLVTNWNGVQYCIGATVFMLITFLIHTTQDYFTSRLNTKLLEADKKHDFFVSVGFDQFLHYAQLLLTYSWIKSWLWN